MMRVKINNLDLNMKKKIEKMLICLFDILIRFFMNVALVKRQSCLNSNTVQLLRMIVYFHSI